MSTAKVKQGVEIAGDIFSGFVKPFANLLGFGNEVKKKKSSDKKESSSHIALMVFAFIMIMVVMTIIIKRQ